MQHAKCLLKMRVGIHFYSDGYAMAPVMLYSASCWELALRLHATIGESR